MEVISDKELLEYYCEQRDIAYHFTNWDGLVKKLVRYKKGEIIALYGDKADKLFFLVKGTIKFSCIADNYEEFFFFNARNEGLFGEVEYVMDIPLITQSEVMEECDCIVIPVEENRNLLDHDLKFQVFLTHILAKKYDDIRRHYMDIESYPLEVRFARYLFADRRSDTIEDLQQISRAIKCSYRQLLRIVKKFCENGWIRHMEQKGKYKIVDRKALEKLMNHI